MLPSRSMALLFSCIFISFFPTNNVLADDFSGAWSGSYTFTNPGYQIGGNLTGNINQTGNSLDGKLSVTGTRCTNLSNLPLSGSVSGNIASFNLSYTCIPIGGAYEFNFINGTLVNNKMVGNWQVYLNGSFYASGTFTLLRRNAALPAVTLLLLK